MHKKLNLFYWNCLTFSDEIDCCNRTGFDDLRVFNFAEDIKESSKSIQNLISLSHLIGLFKIKAGKLCL